MIPTFLYFIVLPLLSWRTFCWIGYGAAVAGMLLWFLVLLFADIQPWYDIPMCALSVVLFDLMHFRMLKGKFR